MTMLQRIMNTEISSKSSLSDAELLLEMKALASAEREATAQLIAALAEVDARRLYLGEGCSSLFTYCTRVLRRSHSLPANVKPSVRTEFSLTHAPPLFCRIPPWFR
jgi:hypothetical protein